MESGKRRETVLLKKVAFISTASNISGATLALLEIIDALREREIESIVFTASRGPLEDKLRDRKVKTYKLLYYSYLIFDGELGSIAGKIKWNIKKIFAKRAEKKVNKVLSKEKPDVIHINTGISPVGIQSAKNQGIPVVWHIREVPETYWNRHVVNYELEKKYLKSVDKVVCISKYIYDIYSKKSPENTMIIYDGVYTEGYEKLRKREVLSGEIIKLSICGFDAFKGHEDAIKAAGILYSEGITNLELTIWGKVEKSYKRKLEEIISDLGIKDNVNFAGYTCNMPQRWAETDIAFMCSRGEAFGRVTIEAMAAGTIVIGSDEGATPELINCDKLLYECRNSLSLAEKIRWLILNPDDARKLAYDCQNMVLSGRYSIERNINELCNLYKNMKNVKNMLVE